jgi:glycerophosphoryl diester phosphodiesterase
MLKPACAAVLVAGFLVSVVSAQRPATAKLLIAHRGASGYAPEHTMPAYQLALDQGADFVEPDLAVSKDGRLICLHDDTLDRTTNVEEIFPDRYSREVTGRNGAKRWVANDFTTAEIQRLDAGRWMDAKYAGTKVPTFEEMVAVVRGKAGIYPELKSPPLYTGRGIDMVKIFVESVKAQRLDTPESLKTTPVIIQSFDWPTVERVARELPTIPRVFLTEDDADVTDARLKQLATFASGIAPDKSVIARHPDMVARAHALGLTVTSWTFRADQKTSYPNVKEEMAQYLYTWGIDALFTNHPDQFPRRQR